jgi:uncharacterized GH25 family protein
MMKSIRMSTAQAVIACAPCIAFLAPALAHEFWIEPSTFTPEPGETVTVALRVGMHFEGEPVPRKNERIERFAALTWPAGATEPAEQLLDGAEDDEPAGKFVTAGAGLTVLVYDSNHSRIELSGADFSVYLDEKGITHVRTQRAEAGVADKTAREIYSRCAKSLVLVGGGEGGEAKSSDAVDRAVGLPLEIIAEFDPYAPDPPKEMRVRVLFNGRPLADAYVSAASRVSPKDAQHTRTDAEGRVTFRLTDAGPWLIDCTHMVAAPESASADYESFWASLTFVVPHK